MIAVKNLQKSFGGLKVLDGIDLDVEQGCCAATFQLPTRLSIV